MTEFKWTRVNNDVYGNPRYVVHYLDVMPKAFDIPNESLSGRVGRYDKTVKLMNKAGGKRFHNKQYGGGIVFQSYNLQETENFIKKVRDEYDAKYMVK